MSKHLLFILLAIGLLLLSHETKAQLTADFSANVTSGCGSLQVSFTDISTSSAGSITSWSWDLGGVNSSSQHPGRIFGTSGFYTICLTATDSQGNTDTECKQDFIRVFKLPEPDFSVSEQQGCIPMHVSFTDLTAPGDAAIDEWIWGLGGTSGVVVDDGTLPSIQTTYNTPDQYTISLTVIDENNCSNTITKTDFITVDAEPVVDVSAPQTFSCDPPFVVDFSNDGDIAGMNFSWDFGNGAVYNGADPSAVVYNTPGQYTITVIGIDQNTNCSDTLVLTDYVQVGYPVEFSYSEPTLCTDGSVQFFDDSAQPADSLLWDFGDGLTDSQTNPWHAYASAGCYTVTLTRYVDGCAATKVIDNCFEVHDLPSIAYSNNNDKGCDLPHGVSFTGNSAQAVQWLWDFGDGNISTQQNPNHTYTEFGVFPVSLTVTDANGCTASVNTDTVQLVELESNLVSGREFGCSPLSVSLKEQSNTVAPIVSWEWHVINNASSPPVQITSFDQEPNLTLTDTGRYEIMLIVENALGCVDTAVFQNRIGVGIPPDIDFSANPVVSCVSSSITFTDQSSNFSDEWIWDFGDGGFSNEEDPMYTYNDTGFFDVTLSAFHLGCENRMTIDSFIHITPPKAKFEYILDCSNPYHVEFIDRSIGADTMFWDFGVFAINTDTSRERSPSYTYPATGYFEVTQAVENFTTGCTDTTRIGFTIADLNVDFSIADTRHCLPATVAITNNSQDADLYSWSAPAGTFSDVAAAEPSLQINTAGAYSDIQLVAADVNGCQDTMLFVDTIFVNKVTANYQVQPSNGCKPLWVDFSDLSTSTFGTINSWGWDFGDSNTSTQQNPQHTYTDANSFSVGLTVRDDWGCEGSLVNADAVDVTFPIASFEADTFGCTQYHITFINHSTGKSLSYFWDFGDGNTSTDVAPTHNYTSEGIYSVCLTVTDLYGCDSVLCRNDYIEIGDPLAAFTADTIAASCPPLLVNFFNNSINANSYQWNFGDESGFSNLENPPHVYTIPGSYDVTLVAIATENCRDTLVLEDLIQIDGPLGDLSFDTDSACIPAGVTFAGQSDGDYMYIWDFGNGIVDTSAISASRDTISYTYIEIGNYVPKLILVNQIGCARAIESPDTIHLGSMEIDFLATDTVLCDNSSATFFNITSSSAPILYQEWLFEQANPATSNEFEPSIQFNSAGQHDVSLIVDNGFCRDTTTKADYIKVGATPTANFEPSAYSECIHSSIQFTDQSSVQNSMITNWDWLFGDGNQSASQHPSNRFNSDGDFPVRLLVTSEIGCQDSIVKTVTIHPKPAAEIALSPEICIGEVSQLQATILSDPSTTTFAWLSDPSLSCTDCLDPVITPSDTTTYYLVTTNNLGCQDTTSTTVNVKPYYAPTITISNDTLICVNDVVQIFVNGGSGTDVYSYQWDPGRPGLTCYEDCFNPIASPMQLTTYPVTVTNEWGCWAADSVVVDVLDEYIPFAGDDRTICEGDTVHLSATYGNSPSWLVTEGLSCTHCPNPVANPAQSTTYLVSVTTDAGCEVKDTVSVNVMHPEDVDAGDDTAVCIGSSTTLNATLPSGQVSWSPAGSLSDPFVSSPEASPSQPTIYYLTVTNGDCIIVDSVAVDVLESTEIDAEDVVICEGESVELEAIGNADTYSWTPSEGMADPDIANPVVSPTETTTYTVTGQLSSCAADEAELTVTVIPAPDAGILPERYFFPGQLVQLNLDDEYNPNYEYNWYPSQGLSCSQCPNPAVTPQYSTTYYLEITDLETGCIDTVSTQVILLEHCPEDLVNVPNIFTPNGDGQNDVLRLHVSPSIKEIKSFQIFNRWGGMVFSTNDINDFWDGRVKGQPLDSGVYVYLIEVPCEIKGNILMKSGDITLLR